MAQKDDKKKDSSLKRGIYDLLKDINNDMKISTLAIESVANFSKRMYKAIIKKCPDKGTLFTTKEAEDIINKIFANDAAFIPPAGSVPVHFSAKLFGKSKASPSKDDSLLSSSKDDDGLLFILVTIENFVKFMLAGCCEAAKNNKRGRINPRHFQLVNYNHLDTISEVLGLFDQPNQVKDEKK